MRSHGFRHRGGRWGRGAPGPEGRDIGNARRILPRSELELLLLWLLDGSPAHGYELIRSIKRLSRGAYAPSSGVIYPALAALEQGGELTSAEEENGRRSFVVTDRGRERVTGEGDALRTIRSRLEALGEGDPERQTPIRRAMNNLKAVLGDLGPEGQRDHAHEVAALIDETAGRIERLRRP